MGVGGWGLGAGVAFPSSSSSPSSRAPGKVERHALCMASIRELHPPPPLPRRPGLSCLRVVERSCVASLQTLLTDFPKFRF